MAMGVTVSNAVPRNWPTDEQWNKADVIVFYSDNPSWNAQTAPQLDAFLARGGGAAFFHYAVDGHQDVEEILAMKPAWPRRAVATQFRHGPLNSPCNSIRSRKACRASRCSMKAIGTSSATPRASSFSPAVRRKMSRVR